MKRTLTILFFAPLSLFAQRRIVLPADSAGSIICSDVVRTYKAVAGDTIVLKGNISNVELAGICPLPCAPLTIVWDTAKPVVTKPVPAPLPTPKDDTLRFSGSYTVTVPPTFQKLKFIGAANGKLNLPTTAKGFSFRFSNSTSKTVALNRDVYYNKKKTQAVFYKGEYKAWYDEKLKQWWMQKL